MPRTPTTMCPSRQAIVVTGGGSGGGMAKSMVKSPAPAATGAVPVPRGRTFHAPGTGSQRYSSSVSPSSRGRSCPRQCKSSCSASWKFQSRSVMCSPCFRPTIPPCFSPKPTLGRIQDRTGPQRHGMMGG
jgi:hypothetical protein